MFGPFMVHEAVFTPSEVEYRGQPTTATIAVAVGRSGALQIELIQPVSGAVAFDEHLRRHGDGLHHVRYPVADMAAKRAELVVAGFGVVMEGHRANGTHWAYLEAPERFGHTLFELIQFPPSDS
jgi:hypothetical protein